MKKTKFLTRLGAVVFALAILFAMAVPAMADGQVNTYTGTYDSTNNRTPAGITGETIPLTKTIVVFNTGNQEVRLPDISYTYTVSPLAIPQGVDITVTDDHNSSEHVESGVAYSITGIESSNPIAFSSTDKVRAKTTGTEVERTGNLTVDLSKFNHAGVYRYKIVESANPTLVRNRGLEPRDDDSYSDTRFMDVYINNPDNDHQTYWMSGAVIFKTKITSTGNAGKDNIDENFEKTTGFQPGTEPTTSNYDYSDDGTVDRYFTYNVEVKKTITGNLANKDHAFPFYVEVSNTTNSALNTTPVTFDVIKNGTMTTGTIAGGGTFTDNNIALADNGSYKLVGVPRECQITVKECNDTLDQYSLTTTLTGTTSPRTRNGFAMASDVPKANQVGEEHILINSGSASGAKADTDTVITFENHLSGISPTGLAFRVAPYVLMLAAGVSLIVLFAKRRREITDMI